MSEAKFTKGMWRVDDCGDVRSIDDGEVIAVVLSDTDEFKTAHLIAAAPELYSDLQECVDALAAATRLGVRGYEELVLACRETLAKARGETL